MNDESLNKIYSEGQSRTHASGLRAVYDAGRNHDAWAIDQRHIAEDASVAAAQKKLDDDKRIADEKTSAEAALTPAQRQQAATEAARVASVAKAAEEKRKIDDKRASEDAAREAARIAALKPTAGTAAAPTSEQIKSARDAARRAGEAEGLKGQRLIDVQDEAEAELIARRGA